MKQPWIIDTTLRDGEQAAGIAFSSEQSFEIAKKLSSVGIPELEIGTPAMGDAEVEKMRRICRAKLGCRTTAWCRAIENDIDVAIRAEVDAVHISFPVSDIHLNALRKSRGWVLEQVVNLVGIAKQRVGYVSVGAQDASRADLDWLKQFGCQAVAAGADRLRIADTVGIWDPIQCSDIIRALRSIVATIDLAVHTHNDLGMATANAIAGIRAGAKFVNTTINGLGERAGNAALEEVVMGLKHACGVETGIDTHRFREMSLFVAKASHRPLSVSKPVVGERVFAHESGLHADGVIKDPHNYEGFDPAEVGLTRSIVVGKHSGTGGLIERYRSMGISIDRTRAEPMLEMTRAMSCKRKRDLTNCELMGIYLENEALPKAA